MTDITKTLTLSTAHISHNTADMLNEESDANRWPHLAVYEKVGPNGKSFGWFIYIDPECEPQTLPHDLCDCVVLAQESDCQLLCLDSDGPYREGMPTYRW